MSPTSADRFPFMAKALMTAPLIAELCVGSTRMLQSTPTSKAADVPAAEAEAEAEAGSAMQASGT